jgi:hypothetical protein
MEKTEATEPIDRSEPAEPMDKIEPVDPMDKIDPLDPMLRSDTPRSRSTGVSWVRFACRNSFTAPGLWHQLMIHASAARAGGRSMTGGK